MSNFVKSLIVIGLLVTLVFGCLLVTALGGITTYAFQLASAPKPTAEVITIKGEQGLPGKDGKDGSTIIVPAPVVSLTVNIPTQTVPTAQAPVISPTAQAPVISPTAQAPAPQNASTDVCRLDKVGTFAEVQNAQTQRIEVGGSAVQHVDYYPDRGVKAVSYIVGSILPQDVPAVWYGFGSIWQALDGPVCAQYDWLSDTTAYASARLDSGHSGLVVDMRNGTWNVVANTANLTQEQITALLAQHKAGMNKAPVASALTPAAQITPAASAAVCKATRTDHTPVVGTPWTVKGPAVLNFWTNEPGKDQAEHKLLIPAGTTLSLLGGGSLYSFPTSGCDQALQDEFAKNSLPAITLADLQSLGLVK